MRVFTAIILVCFFLFDALGYYFLFENKMLAAKSEAEEVMHDGIPQRDLTTIVFSAEAAARLSWNDDHEFFYNHELYDVVNVKQTGNRIIYTCYHDENERSIISDYISGLKRNMHPAAPRNTSRKNSLPADKYCCLYLRVSIHPSNIFATGTSYIKCAPGPVYSNVPLQPPDCG